MMNPSEMPTTSRAVESEPEQRTRTAKKKRKAAPQANNPSEFGQILDIIQSPYLVQYLQAKGLLATEVRCRCRKSMTLRILRQHTDGFAFRCNKCGTKRALRTGSVFKDSRLTLSKAMRTAVAFLEGNGVVRCAAVVGIGVTAAVQWYDIWRDVCSKALLKEAKQLGGPEVEVQVDETLITRRKYNVARLRNEHWILGMYDTCKRKAIFEQVNDRSWSSLKAVIKKWVAPGSIIVTAQWKAYAKLSEEGYRHETVNHSKNFVDPTSRKNTNAIEAYWSRLKKKLRERGPTKGRRIWAYLDEAQYRLWFGLKASLSSIGSAIGNRDNLQLTRKLNNSGHCKNSQTEQPNGQAMDILAIENGCSGKSLEFFHTPHINSEFLTIPLNFCFRFFPFPSQK
nr:unnamed protein product [Spirometra erinaceieuropaei]